MSKTTVVHCRGDVYDKPDYVYVGRPSKWGNPFILGEDGTRKAVLEKYRNWIKDKPELLDSLHEIRGKKLGCWCHPKPCHADILKELCDNLGYEEDETLL